MSGFVFKINPKFIVSKNRTIVKTPYRICKARKINNEQFLNL